MRSNRAILLSLFVALVASVSACRPIDKPDDNIDPPAVDPGNKDDIPGDADEIQCEISINGTAYKILSAGYYHDTGKGGFDFVFSSSEVDLSNPLNELPSGTTIYIDVPDIDVNRLNNLPSIVPGDNWDFYFGYAVDGKQAIVNKLYDIRSISIKAGQMFVSCSNGSVDMTFDATLLDGTNVAVRYKGMPAKSDSYIYCWNS